ncbi:carbon-nitrogen hydrolase family protein [Dietzia alimentaria]|uniref:carbon-nitrogen hydrolase family protein n=1 Tax=Dietzia alimentaria TaxID=665550 RepID=UPI00029B19B8|nr:carbon-nitrogen hydrolase family protein [Dietzia alimentaria]
MVRAAAIQLEGVPGRVDLTLGRLEALITEAAEQGARLIAVPEFCTSPVPLRAEVHEAVLPRDNRAVDLFRRLAARHGATIGGSMLIADDDEVYNRYHLVEPDGRVHTHDKDLPTMWENCFYTGGRDDGAFDTGLGGVGVASCWELIRTQTVRRLRDRVGIAMTGTHWWTVPNNWGALTDRALGPLAQYNRYLSENAPAEFARRLGVPVLQASHCGSLRTDFLLAPRSDVSVPYVTDFVGSTQIVDADGTVLASRRTTEGPGIVYADVEPGAREPVTPLEERFWIPELPLLLRGYWHQQNVAGRSYYRRTGRAAGLRATVSP